VMNQPYYREAVGAARRATHSRAEAERLTRPPCQRAERHPRIVAAAGIDVHNLSEHGRRVPGWLADWDEPTIEIAVELVATTRARAAGAAAEIGHDSGRNRTRRQQRSCGRPDGRRPKPPTGPRSRRASR
jgi:hypothetical protein